MKQKTGNKIIPVELPALDGLLFNSESLSGKRIMISFFRFATCPFCNMRMHQLVSRFNEFGSNFTIIAIFDSSLKNLQKSTKKHNSPFPVLADEKNVYYKKYGIEHSVLGMTKGMIFRFPTLIKGLLKGYIPIPITGSMTTMPADFLVNEKGIIQTAYYGKDEGDHLSVDRVKEFSLV